MKEYYNVEGLKVAGCDIYVDDQDAVNKVGIALRDIMIENLKVKNAEVKQCSKPDEVKE
jgi:hypothetical protein